MNNSPLTLEVAPTTSAQWWPTLHLKKGRKLIAATPEQLAVVREIYNAGRGASEIRSDVLIYDETGTRIGRVSYNGRVWLHDVEGDIEVPQSNLPTAAQRELQGWK